MNKTRHTPPLLLAMALLLCTLVPLTAQGQWQAVEGDIVTRWAKQVSPENAHREYPRPQLVRAEWLNLNGLWDYAIRSRAACQPCAHYGPASERIITNSHNPWPINRGQVTTMMAGLSSPTTCSTRSSKTSM